MLKRSRKAVLLCLFFALFSVGLTLARQFPVPATPAAESPKGQWGTVTPIADNRHPNLFYNQSEIDELRDLILVKRSPQHLVDLYSGMRDQEAEFPHNDPHYKNSLAAVSYMIEPASYKADAIRTTLLRMMSAFPDGLPAWFEPQGCSFCGYSTAWLFDLIMGYHPDKFSPQEVLQLKDWFAKSAQKLRIDTRDPGIVGDPPSQLPRTREGKTIVRFPNWFNRYLGLALAFSLVSGNQADVDYWADSGWPHNLFTFDGVTAAFPSNTANRYDLIMYLLAVFPSGANSDSYDREGYRLPQSDWYTTSYYADPTDGGDYHWAQISGAILGAEMVYHNGMNRVFEITDVPGTEPALLRSYKRAVQSRSEIDNRPTSRTGHPHTGYQVPLWAGYRRYADPLIEGAVSTSVIGFTPDMPTEVWQFFGYPRRIVWGQNNPGPGPGPGPGPVPVSLKFEPPTVPVGTFVKATFSGPNLNSETHFDLRIRVPGSNQDQEVWNWQKGTSTSHLLPSGTPYGEWTVTGVRAHQNENDHSAQMTPVSATLSVVFNPFGFPK